MTRVRDHIHAAVRTVFAETTSLSSETEFQAAFAMALGSCERELRATFADPIHPPKRPPQSAIDKLLARNPRKVPPPEGKDPCARAAKLDILWASEAGPVPIELKYRNRWTADTYGYMFLKDLHRLERMTAAGLHTSLAGQRFAIFVTTEPVYWKGERPEPAPF